MKVIYQNKEYTIEQLNKEQRDFENSLDVPNYLHSNDGLDFFCFDPQYKLAIDFFSDLYSQITSARFALVMGHKKLHDSNYVKWNSGEIGQYWLRFQYLKNSINWYNSSFDILWQAIWFGFALYRKIEFSRSPKKIHDIDSPKAFKTLLERCKWDYIVKSLSEVDSVYSKDLLNQIKKFNDSQEQKVVRKWANSLKHHGSFRINELYNPGSALIVGVFDSRYARPTIIEIDKITEALKEYHIAYCELTKYVFDFFNFDGMRPPIVNGKTTILQKDEKDYKKIIIK